MNILVTGGAGFIGNALVNDLVRDESNTVYVLDSMTEQIHGADWEKSYLYLGIKDKCKFIKGDIRDYGTVENAVQNSDYIIHLAAETGTGQSMYEINKYNEVNIMGTSNLFQAISANNVKLKKFILTSSRSVYGEGKYHCSKHGVMYPQARKVEDMKVFDYDMHCPICNEIMKVVPTSEDSKIIPSSLYAFTKYAQEKMVETMCKALGINYTIFRLQNVYGVGQSLKNPYTGILSIFSTLLLCNKQINIFEDGKESRDFINVKDVSAAIVKSLLENKTNGEIINLGSGIGTSVIEIAEILKKFYKSSSIINITNDFRIGDIAHNIADTTKAEALLGFKTSITLEEGLKDFVVWVENQEIGSSGYEESLNEMEKAGMFIRNKR